MLGLLFLMGYVTYFAVTLETLFSDKQSKLNKDHKVRN